MTKNNLDIQGHRGCRGLMPENTIGGFLKAVDLGVTTLEMDVVISGDNEIIVSHEPFFNHLISLHPKGEIITEENEKNYNLYQMKTAEIQLWDVGSKEHPKFPIQSKISSFKPTLNQVVDTIENYVNKHQLQRIRYNIEIKHNKSFDNIYHPNAYTFTKKVFDAIVDLQIRDRTCIQSFDPDCLNILNTLDSTMTTALLVENTKGYKFNLEQLTFKPTIYSPYYKLIDSKLLEYCENNQIQLIPWTVNKESDITKMIQLGVDGIISDYPDKVIEIYDGIRILNNH